MERCKIHTDEYVQRICEKCDYKAVCVSCIIECHQGHTFVKYGDVISQLKRMKQENKKEKERLETDLTRLLSSRRYLQRASREMKRQLEERKKFLKKKLDQIKKKLEESEDLARTEKEKTVTTLERQIKESIAKRTKFDGELQKILSLERTTELSKAFGALRPPRNEGYVIPETIPSRCFVPGPLEDSTLEEIFGEMYDTDHRYETIGTPSIRNNSSSNSLKTVSSISKDFSKTVSSHDNKEMNSGVTASKDSSSVYQESDGGYAEVTPSRNSLDLYQSKSADPHLPHQNQHGHVKLKFKDEQLEKHNKLHDNKEMNSRVTASKYSSSAYQENDGAYAEVTPSKSSLVLHQSKSVDPDFPHPNKRGLKSKFKDEQFEKDNTLFIARSDTLDHYWVKRNELNIVTLEDKTTKIKHKITFSQSINGISTLAGNKLLVCIPECACIRLVDKYSALDFVKTAPLHPRVVCSGRFGGIFAILCDLSEDACTPTGASVLVRYKQTGNNGQEEIRTNKDKFGKDLFQDPRKISVNKTGKRVVVINAISKHCSHLLLFSGKLELLWRYYGDGKTYPGDKEIDESLLHMDTDMCISDAVFDTNDNIIIADQQSNSIKILDKNLNKFCMLGTYSNHPCALALVDNKIWIWFDNGHTSVETYKVPSFN